MGPFVGNRLMFKPSVSSTASSTTRRLKIRIIVQVLWMVSVYMSRAVWYTAILGRTWWDCAKSLKGWKKPCWLQICKIKWRCYIYVTSEAAHFIALRATDRTVCDSYQCTAFRCLFASWIKDFVKPHSAFRYHSITMSSTKMWACVDVIRQQ